MHLLLQLICINYPHLTGLVSKYVSMFRYLLDTYGWRGTLFIMGGMMLHAIPFSYLMHEPPNSHIAPPLNIEDEINEDMEAVEQRDKTIIAHNGYIGQRSEPLLIPGKGNGYVKSVEMQMSNGVMENCHIKSVDCSSSPTSQENRNGYTYSCSLPKNNGFLEGSLPKVIESNSIPKTNGFLSSPIHRSIAVQYKHKKSGIHSSEAEKVHFCDEVNVDDGEKDTNEETGNIILCSENINGNANPIPLPSDEVEEVMIPSWTCSLCTELITAVCHVAKGFSELKDPVCLLMFLAAVFVCVGYHAPYLFLPMKAIIGGNSPWSAAALISITGISDAFGRIFFGWLGNFRYPGKMVMLTFSTFTSGLSCLMFGLVTPYPLLAFFCAVYGLSVGRYHNTNLSTSNRIPTRGIDKKVVMFTSC